MGKLTRSLSTQFPPTSYFSPGCLITGHAGAPDNQNGLFVVLELPLEAPDHAPSTRSVRNTPDFERPLPFYRAAIWYPAQEKEQPSHRPEASSVG